jgi:hypothetical protein
MEHDEAIAQMESAAAEPGGLDRLMAGDTADARALAAHLAGCPSCADELGQIRTSAGIIRRSIRDLPAADLRERTLAYVRAVGRPRAFEAGSSPAFAAVGGGAGMAVGSATPASSRLRRWRIPGSRWAAGLAATAVLASAVASAVTLSVTAPDRSRLAAQDATIGALAEVTTWTFRIDGKDDSQYVELASGTVGPAAGSLIFSPSTRELVVIASDLPQPPDGQEYRCWIEKAPGSRERVGKMFFGGGLAYWVGVVDAVQGAGPGARFGVSLAPVDSKTGGGDPVITGTL